VAEDVEGEAAAVVTHEVHNGNETDLQKASITTTLVLNDRQSSDTQNFAWSKISHNDHAPRRSPELKYE
jgi:hypothetical protein